MGKSILLIGRNPTVLTSLASALTREGFSVATTNAVEKANQEFNGADFDLVAFGRGVDNVTNASLRADFLGQNPGLLFVDGLAPVIPLLVKQINLALLGDQSKKKIAGFACVQPACSVVQVTVSIPCQLTIDLYELDAVHTTRQQNLLNEPVIAGTHTFSLSLNLLPESGIRFLAAQADNRDLWVLPLQ